MSGPLRRDYSVLGCAVCRLDVGESHLLPMRLEPPYGSLDARDDVRMHRECYRRFVWAVWAVLGFAEPPPYFL